MLICLLKIAFFPFTSSSMCLLSFRASPPPGYYLTTRLAMSDSSNDEAPEEVSLGAVRASNVS